jgi:tRNA (guanine37-N1)-methyltransferase
MKFHVISLFPDSIGSYRDSSLIARSEKKGVISIQVTNPRDFSFNKHNKVDDKPYGGGPGMIMQALPVLRAVEHSLAQPFLKKIITIIKDAFSLNRKKTHCVVFSPSGKKFTNDIALDWAQRFDNIVLICGRYEGIDDRVREILQAEEISIGDYVLTGGELPALVVMDAVSRQLPGMLGNQNSREEARVASPRVYTRPESFEWKGVSYSVPHVLIQGNHKEIELWRSNQKKK